MHKMWKISVLVLMLSIANKVYSCAREDLQMVQIVSKHCSMSPPFTYPLDPNPASLWTEGLNDLTMLGKFQAYALGAFLRNFYSDFISSDPRELEVFSSADKGVAKSAQSLVTALYTPNDYWEIVQNFPWQPIYINYDSMDGFFLSKYQCPSAEVELKRTNLKETKALLQTYQNLMNFWSMNSGIHLKSVTDVAQLFEVLLTELAHNLTIPAWSQPYWNELKYFYNVANSLETKTSKLIKLQGGILIDRIMKTMRDKAINDKDQKKVVVYSSHTSPLLALLAVLDFKDFEYLPPCSTLLVEQYKTDGEYFVRYLFLNSTDSREVYTFSMPGCMEFCPLDYVVEYTSDCIRKKFDKECFMI